MPLLRDIPQLPSPHYRVDVVWDLLEEWLAGHEELNLSPDFQRGHVWTDEQQTAYLEWVIRGGESGKEIHFNHPNWMTNWKGEMVIVDGLQRLTAVRRWLKNEVRTFGLYRRDFTDKFLPLNLSFSVRICNLKTREEILKWYLDFNSGGTPHRAEEIQRVRDLLKAEMVKNAKC